MSERRFPIMNSGGHDAMRELADKDRRHWQDEVIKRDAEINKLRTENAQLREIVSQISQALPNGAYVAPNATVEFMKKLPAEITLVFWRIGSILDSQ